MANTTFYRLVRSYPERLPNETIKIEPPPQKQQKPGGAAALMQMLYPLSGILMSSIFIFSSTAMNRGPINPWIIVAEVGIIPLSVGMMFLSGYFQKRSMKQNARAERENYKKYLAGRERRLAEIARQQKAYNARLYPQPSTLINTITSRQYLWERRPVDADFLTVRVGLAATPLCCKIEFQEDYRTNYEPELLHTVRELTTQKSHLDRQPLTISLSQVGTIAITGPRAAARALLRGIFNQIIAFHSPFEVRIAALFPQDARSDWGWLKWLPHTRRLRLIRASPGEQAEQLCMLAENVADFQDILLTQIKPEVERRIVLSQDTRGKDSNKHKLPHLILLVDGFVPGTPLAAGLEDILRNSTQLGITIFCLVERAELEPATIQARLALAPVARGAQLHYIETRPGGLDVEFVTPDAVDATLCERMARLLTPLNVIDADAELDFSQDIRLLALQNIPSVDELQVAKHWQERTDQQLLCVPIGQQKNGPLLLDLKEMAVGGYGPHGLVVGATGSGKSELLRTVVTSLALTHDPHTLNFILVDFKAGAAFADFENLPHVAGIITNLENDPLLISRMHASLLGEQNRRQMLLSQAGNLSNIRQYQARWRKNPRLEPMPYLLIIVDEFAQLIANHEEFLALFTKFGQVGRSLGMHMMLSTQRVDEGRIRSLEGHLRYRICLRTFKPDESTAVIGKPDAYYLPPSPGSGYMKVDDDIYTAFKTALISTPYVPPKQQEVDPASLIRIFTSAGKLVPTQRIAQVATNSQLLAEEETRTEMSVVVSRIKQSKPLDSWRVHAVWQPPLKEEIPLDEVLLRCNQSNLDGTHWSPFAPFGALTIPIGILDRPAEQVQEPVFLDFSGIGGHLAIIGAPQSGKSTLLRTIITSFIVTHSPLEVQLYCIDMGGGLLRVFDGAPHIGAVCGKSDRDKIRRLVHRMRQILIERETLFSERGIDSMVTYRRMRQENALPQEQQGDVFLLIDNFGQLQSDFENQDADIINDITTLIANGLTYGVHVILTANLWIEIRPRLRSNIGTRLELRQNDPSDSEIDRKQAATIPADLPGRGLHQTKLLFQTALPIIKGSHTLAGASVQQILEEMVQRVRTAWKGPIAPQILVLPLKVRWEGVQFPIPQPAGVPIGLEEFRLSPLFIDLLQKDPHFLILGDRECGKTTLLRTWMHGFQQIYTPDQVKILLIDYRKTLLDMSKSAHLLAYAFTVDQARESVKQIKAEMEQRLTESMALPVEQLQTPHPWSGLHYVILVDDYETVATLDPRSGNPLVPLEGLLQSARDIGLHVIVARRVTNITQTNMDPFFRNIKTMEGPGFLMRGDTMEGRQILHKQNISDQLPTGRGQLVRRGYPPTLVQVAR